ncbi:MAG: hypothetical protein ACR2NU_02340 [Aeoliella sp.]
MTKSFDSPRIQSASLPEKRLADCPDEGRDQQVVVRYFPLLAHNLAEQIWHAPLWLELLVDGSLLFHAALSGVDEFSWRVLG